jgi:GDP-4-dehydro-6-deoxy-D-mannose reductase
MKKILITGGAGFAATHLIKLLLKENTGFTTIGYEIHATKRVRTDMYRPDYWGLTDKVHWHLIELTDAHSVSNVIKEVMPDQIYHLAAQDYVKSSWDSPKETFDTNVNGLINLYMAIRNNYNPGMVEVTGEKKATSKCLDYPKILVTSTSETYGYYPGSIHEQTEMRPLNPYGVSKMAMDHLARIYAKGYNIPTVITRAFNITGWGRNDPFVDSNFARQIVNAEKGFAPAEIRHGNLEAKRSFFDVKDAVLGYYLAMQYESKYPYEVFCFGPEESTSIKDLLYALVKLSTENMVTVHDPARHRPIDTPDMICDAAKAKQLLNWECTIPLEESLKDLLDYWRERLR